MRHLTERELIEYQFKLVSDDRLKEITSHLQDCTKCSEYLEKVKRKFAALELLREEPKVSEDLISSVVEHAKLPTRTKALFRKSAWISAAAAALLVGSLLLVAHLNKQTALPSSLVKKEGAKELTPAADKTTFEVKSDTSIRRDIAELETKSALADRLGESSSIVSRPSSLVAPPSSILSTEEQPPFAPASAIELVVLPRRENVQLTIYNSADLKLVRERRNFSLKKGWNWLQFMWANTFI